MRTRSTTRLKWVNPIVGKIRPAYWPEEAIEGKPLPDMAQQQFKEEVNINKIVSKYKKSGNISLLQQAQTYYADTTQHPKDYGAALRQLSEAQEQFDALPAYIRKQFDHDPSELLAFIKKPDNKAQAQALGLLPADPKKSTSAHPTPSPASETPKPKGIGEAE